jgi:hypothetical protein
MRCRRSAIGGYGVLFLLKRFGGMGFGKTAIVFVVVVATDEPAGEVQVLERRR